jgi:gliding motility-associated protein GldC
MNMTNTEKNIQIRVALDPENRPVQIRWSAEDDPNGTRWQDSKAMLLALFDRETLDTLKIDLWTRDMQVMEMDRFFFQTLRSLADTYYRATQNSQLSTDFQRFVQYFGEQTEIIPKK